MTPEALVAFSILGLGVLLSWLSFRYQLGLLCECIEGLAAEHEEQHETLRVGLLNTDSFARGQAKISAGNFQLVFDTLTYLAAETKSAVNHFNERSASLEAHSLSLRTQAQAHADRTEAAAISGRLPRTSPGRTA